MVGEARCQWLLRDQPEISPAVADLAATNIKAPSVALSDCLAQEILQNSLRNRDTRAAGCFLFGSSKGVFK
jgi:hypothetical protein